MTAVGPLYSELLSKFELFQQKKREKKIIHRENNKKAIIRNVTSILLSFLEIDDYVTNFE